MSRLTSVGSFLFDVVFFFLFCFMFFSKPGVPVTAAPPSDFFPALCAELLTTTLTQMTFIPSMSRKKKKKQISCCVCYVLTTNNFSASNAVSGELLCQQMAKWDLVCEPTTVKGSAIQ